MGFYYVSLPDKYYLSGNNELRIDTFFDIIGGAAQNSDAQPVYAESGCQEQEIDLRLFGLFPIKRVRAEQIERPLLIPGGTPFGIKILTDGAIVTEFGMVDGEGGYSSPARDGGIKAGDVIVRVNDVAISSNGDVSEAVQLNPERTEITFIRDGKEHRTNVTPVRSTRDGLLKIGMWVRDSSAGIGTMTFFNPADMTFGGLGHGVCDIDTGQILPLSSGQAVPVYISGVIRGFPGAPGELCGTFLSRIAVGDIQRNTHKGVFGFMDDPPAVDGAIEMAYKQEVTVGPATIITTIDGDTPREFEIIIEKIDYNDKNDVKNMVIRVIDRELLSSAGGIVQGMSGSPIIQNGRLAGAVTHVFVGDPTRGYAIFAENMYRESLELQPATPELTLIECGEAACCDEAA